MPPTVARKAPRKTAQKVLACWAKSTSSSRIRSPARPSSNAEVKHGSALRLAGALAGGLRPCRSPGWTGLAGGLPAEGGERHHLLGVVRVVVQLGRAVGQ